MSLDPRELPAVGLPDVADIPPPSEPDDAPHRQPGNGRLVVAERVPRDDLAEQAVLGAVLNDPSRLEDVPHLEPSMFYGSTHGRAFDAIRRLVSGCDSMGLAHGDHLVSVLQNRYEAATLHWASQLAGVIIAPLNWRATAEEIAYVLDDADARAVIFGPVSREAVLDAASGRGIPTVSVAGAEGGDHVFDQLTAGNPAEPTPRAAPADISVMLYTSGTTGRGKGVPRTHLAERAAALAHIAQNRYRYGERTLGVMPLYHTMGVRSLLSMALVNGVFVCQPRFDAATALELIAREAVTNLYLVPTLYHDLLVHAAFDATDVSSVSKLGFAGAPMTDGLLRRCQAAFSPDLFVNHYGSSEIYTFTVCPDAPAKPGSAGKAGINQRIRVVRIGSTSPDDEVAAREEGQIIASLDSDEAFAKILKRLAGLSPKMTLRQPIAS